MQALCQWDVQQDQSSTALGEFLAEQDAPAAATTYATELVESFWRQRQFVDDLIGAAAEKWELARISAVERNIMRVAVVELLDNDVPPKVALDEAIELGKEFGGAESPRFVNGVLDKVLRSMPQGDQGSS